MRKLYLIVAAMLCVCFVQAGNTSAQQAPASNSTKTPSPKAQTAAPAKAPPAKPGQTTAARRAPTPKTLTLTTPKEKASYALGVNIGHGLTKDAVEVDPGLLFQGLKDGMAGGKTQMTDDELKAALASLQADVMKRQQEKMQVLGEADKKEGDAFLGANKTKEGVVTLPSGLQYKIVQQGTGPKPTASDTVTVNYRGTLLDGTEFDSSYKRGQPATFAVGQIIRGWTEALQLMPVGSKWQLFIPPELAYGPRSPSPVIPPNSTLIFEVELLSIQPKNQPNAGQAVPPTAK